MAALPNSLSDALEEMIEDRYSPETLRNYFAAQLASAIDEDVDLRKLKAKEAWDRFATDMSLDYYRRCNFDDIARAEAYAYIDDQIFKKNRRHIDDIPEFYPVHLFDNKNEENFDEIAMKVDQFTKKLNSKQAEAVEKVIDAIKEENNNKSNCYFITGVAGTGKTFVYKAIYYEAVSIHKKVICIAPTGIAATLLPNGSTAHKMFKIPFDKSKFISFSNDSTFYGSKHANELEEASAIIIDEVTMMAGWQLSWIDQVLRFLMHKEDVAFGGKVILAGGDFRQLTPVGQKQPLEENVKFERDENGIRLWQYFEEIVLTKNMRAKKDEEFSSWLETIGNGDERFVKMPEKIITSKPLHKEIFKDDCQLGEYELIANKAIVTPTNESAKYWNERVLELLPDDEEVEFLSNDKREDGRAFDADDYDRYPPRVLTLRKNATIMMLTNMKVEDGLCNGTRFRYLEEKDGFLRCESLCEQHYGKEVLIPRINLLIKAKGTPRFIRNQYPVDLAFAITIHKAQGQTFDKVGIDLANGFFSHGHMYVSLSRVSKFGDVKIYHSSHDLSKHYIENIVIKSLLSNISDPCSPVKRMKIEE